MIFFLVSNQVLLARRIPPDEYYEGGDWPTESFVIGWIIGLVWSIKIQLDDGETPTIGFTLFMTFFMGVVLSFPIGILFIFFT
ncbi:hypothetical protein N8Y61_02110 [Akkermansiaceae bacterium]|nr:hypothetical protein [Akkermansiaceae bacterium]